MKKLTIVLYKDDLRTHDHPALYEGVKEGSVLPIYIKNAKNKRTAKDAWIDQSLKALKDKFNNQDQSFLILDGDVKDTLSKLITEMGATQVSWNVSFTKQGREEDKDLREYLNSLDVNVNEYNGQTLFPFKNIFNQAGGPYKVFTPFYKKCLQEELIKPYPEPEIDPFKYVGNLTSEVIDNTPKTNWEAKLSGYWSAGEDAAYKQIELFVNEGLNDYKTGRDYPAKDVVSKLSPYLAVGSLSIRRLYVELSIESLDNESNLEAFYRQLIWRDFSYYTLVHFPEITEEPLRDNFNYFPWKNEPTELKAWKNGKTGYPFVDAAMRELWETGYMHNRARMVVGSFLVKHLLINWKIGYAWFEETLIDFDPANNAMGWQWVTGSGIDSSPYFRVFNPLTQSEKFDPSAKYINQYVPEVHKLHQPFKKDTTELKDLEIVLGETYPYPIVDHKAARERALDAFDSIKNKAKSK